MIVRAFNLNGYDKENVFDDVLEGAWYEDAIMKAYYSNIINGMSENQFGIGLNITRQDMCVIVYNTLQLNKSELLGEREVSEFLDEANIADYAITAVKQLQKEGIVSGDSSGYFNPLGNATRAETAVVMNAVLKYIK